MLFAIQPPSGRISIGRCHSVFVDGLPRELAIETVKPLPECFRNKGIRMCCDHDVGVARIGPLGHPAAFFEILQEGRDHAGDALWCEQREHAVFGSERVPD